MAAGDTYHISGGLAGRHATAFLGGDVNDMIQVDAHGVARVAANDAKGTYTAWINLADITGTYCVLGGADLNADEFLDITVEAGLLTVRITDATTVQLVTQADQIDFTPHKWYHIAVTQSADGAGPRLYVNGSLINSTNDTTTDVDSWYAELDGIDQFQIGVSQKGGAGAFTLEFAGAISDVKYWNIALTADEVEKDSRDVAVQASTLQLHLDMDNDFIDAGLGADNGTAVGDIILDNNYSEFTSRLKHTMAAPVVVGDDITISIDSLNNTGHAIVVKAA